MRSPTSPAGDLAQGTPSDDCGTASCKDIKRKMIDVRDRGAEVALDKFLTSVTKNALAAISNMTKVSR